MTNQQSLHEQLEQRINRYDLLQHEFYKAWSNGDLTRLELLDYAQNYFHHVESYTECLDNLLKRLPAGETRKVIEENKADELGGGYSEGRPHTELWLDFVEGMGGRRDFAPEHKPLKEVRSLIDKFVETTETASVAEGLATLYAYESQVPRLAVEKVNGLKELYGADDKACIYFQSHAEEDKYHSEDLLKEIQRNVGSCDKTRLAVLDSAEQASKWLWNALDGFERLRQERMLLPTGSD